MIDRQHIEKKLARLQDVETQLADPAASANRQRYRDLVREHAGLARLRERSQRYFKMLDDQSAHQELLSSPDADADLKALAKEELEQLQPALPAAEMELTVALLPPDPDEDRNAIMEIRAGTGGDEAALFAGDLFRMYSRYVEAQGWKVGLIDASPGTVGGYKEVVFSVQGSHAYGRLRYESGGHRVQRIPATEAQGRIHTSAATVGVFPEVEEEDDIEIPADELRIDIFCSSGPGGQSVNTTYSAVRMTHLPTGLVAQSQDERSQHRNKDKALAVLKARLLDKKRREEAERVGKTRRTLIGSGDRSERVRTYNFPQNRVSDHRINLTLYSLDRVMEGNLDAIITGLCNHDLEQRLKAEIGG